MKSEALSIVQKEKGSALFCSLTYRAESEFVADAVLGTHEFSSLAVREFVCLFY